MSTTAQTTQQDTIVNGVNVTKLADTIEAVKQDPSIADFNFRVTNKWIHGGHNRFTIKDFYGAKQTLAHKQPFTFSADEPAVLLGEDQGANPVEYVLGALSGCMTTTLVYKASAEGHAIESVESEYTGDIDLQGLLETDENADPGYKEIRVKFRIKGDVPAEKVKELVKKSPVYDTLTRPIKIVVDVEKV